MTQTHIPVLAGELIDLLDPHPGETAVDCTFGGGGHARLIADRLGPEGTLIGIDRDPVAEERFGEIAAELPCRTRFIRADFVSALGQLDEEGVRADLAYLDLGMSSMQVDTWERGFSYAYDAPLDMRMGPEQDLTAREIVNEWDERRLARLLREYGEERYANRIARGIVRARDREEIVSTQQLVDVIKAAVPVPAQFAGGHPARRTFQALRIAVNDELFQLDAALPAVWKVLRTGGRFAAISFHSLEDRRVKRFLADRARGCVCPPELPVCVCGHHPEAELLTRRAVGPTQGEIEANPRSKSAHLRAARKLEGDAALGRKRRRAMRPGALTQAARSAASRQDSAGARTADRPRAPRTAREAPGERRVPRPSRPPRRVSGTGKGEGLREPAAERRPLDPEGDCRPCDRVGERRPLEPPGACAARRASRADRPPSPPLSRFRFAAPSSTASRSRGAHRSRCRRPGRRRRQSRRPAFCNGSARSSWRCPTTRCSTASSAAGPGSRCSACCWPGSSRRRSRS